MGATGVVIWGFDLSKITWSAFGHKKMFDKRWYLRRERFVLYQLAMTIGLVAECTATYSLSKYESLKRHVEHYPLSSVSSSPSDAQAFLNQTNIISGAICTIVFCVLVATLFGADFFFLLFWPERSYPVWHSTTKKALAVTITAGIGASAIVSTWVIACQNAVLTGVDDDTATQLLDIYYRPPVLYNRWATNIAWVVLLWIAFLGTVASTFVMFLVSTHDEKYGPSASAGTSTGKSDKDKDKDKDRTSSPNSHLNTDQVGEEDGEGEGGVSRFE